MFGHSSIHSRRWLLRATLLTAFLASLAVGLAIRGYNFTAHADSNSSSVPAKYAFVVILDGGHPELYNSTNAPFINDLKTRVATYTNAQLQVPAHSITNIMGLFTGTDATHH